MEKESRGSTGLAWLRLRPMSESVRGAGESDEAAATEEVGEEEEEAAAAAAAAAVAGGRGGQQVGMRASTWTLARTAAVAAYRCVQVRGLLHGPKVCSRRAGV
jgi:hypothetical protein